MNNGEPHPRDSDELRTLIDALLDARADKAQQRRLQELLQSDPEAQALFLRYVNLHSCLRMAASGGIQPEASGPSISPAEKAGPASHSAPGRWRLPVWGAVAGIAAGFLLVFWGLRSPPSRQDEQDAPARVVEVHGQLEVVAKDGTVRPIEPGVAIPAGETVRSGESGGKAVIERAGDHIELGADTFVSFTDRLSEEIKVAEGAVHLQANRQALIVRTPHAEVRADKAMLSLVVTKRSTRLSVDDGSAELIRLADNQTLSMSRGTWALVEPGRQPLAAHIYARQEPLAVLKARGVDAALSPDGAMVAVITEPPASRLELWDVASRQRTATLETARPRLTGLAFSPDGAMLASGGTAPFLQLWDLKTQQVTRTIHVARAEEEAVWPAFSMDGKQLGAIGHLRAPHWGLQGANFWNAADGEIASRPPRWRKIKCMAALPGTASFVGGTDDGDAVRWNGQTGADEATYKSGQRKPVKKLAVSGDGRWLAHPAADGILVWDVKEPRQRHLLDGTGTLAFSPDGRLLAAASLGYLDVWDVATGARVTTIATPKDAMQWLAFTPDGQTLLALSGVQKRILLWKMPASE